MHGQLSWQHRRCFSKEQCYNICSDSRWQESLWGPGMQSMWSSIKGCLNSAWMRRIAKELRRFLHKVSDLAVTATPGSAEALSHRVRVVVPSVWF